MPIFHKFQFFKNKNNYLVLEVIRAFFFYSMVGLFYLSGIILILMVTSHDAIINLPIIKDRFYGLASMALIRQVPSLLLGFALLVCGRAIGNRSAKAFFPTLIFLSAAVLYTIFFYRSFAPTVVLILLVILLWLSRPNLYRRQLIISHEDGFLDGLIWSFLSLSYFILGYTNLVDSHHQSRISLEEHFSVPSFHWWLMGLLTLVLIAISSTVLILFLKHLRVEIGQPFDKERFEQIIKKGDHHYTGLAYLQDKRIWYYQAQGQDQIALQFRAQGDKLLVMGDFFGYRNYFDEALEAFMSEADLYNYHPVFYEVSEQEVMAIHDHGFDFIKLGEEGIVTSTQFSLSGKKKQNLRSVSNQVEKAGYVFSVLKPPYSKELITSLKVISDEWLAGRKEMGFSLGFFDDFYLSHSDIAILRSREGEIVAFATIEKSDTEKMLSVDLMRYLNKAPKGVMDALFIRLINHAKLEGFDFFNMGMCPLSNVGKNRFSFFNEKMGYLLYQYGSQIYSFDGLRHYKQKFAHKWVPYYIAYPKQCLFLFVILALVQVSYRQK
ncbi:lysyl-tRNA synthetase [Streptococcus pseudoporcinus]|uniref:Lysyl-tRNA synthetase n=1 Tax=Streptococcus pseudoporcinus TaxID=361101 RepID=A0A4U9Z8J7_9STRE|nr:phosphatidylglycerol lysyltransferase domain-containing protein [Streptococcus pseudoporcinus]VTS36142.1 lysyl-tRNA synthetase [Streptococcus pseudoporcinus]